MQRRSIKKITTTTDHIKSRQNVHHRNIVRRDNVVQPREDSSLRIDPRNIPKAVIENAAPPKRDNFNYSFVDKIWDDDEINDTTMPETEETEDQSSTAKSIDIKDKVASAMKSSGLSAVRLFTAIDQTNDGYVSRREIRTAVNTLLKDSVKVSDIDAMLETFDENGDGVISLDEFLSVMEEHEPKQFVPVLPDLKPPGKKKK